MSSLAIPYSIVNDTPADATQVEANFDSIKTWSDVHVVEKSGATLTGPLVLSGAPAVDDGAVRRIDLDNATRRVGFSLRSTFSGPSSSGSTTAVSFQTEYVDTETAISVPITNVPFALGGVYVVTCNTTVASGSKVGFGSEETRVTVGGTTYVAGGGSSLTTLTAARVLTFVVSVAAAQTLSVDYYLGLGNAEIRTLQVDLTAYRVSV